MRDGGGLNQTGGGRGGGKWSDRGRIFKSTGMNELDWEREW